MTEMIQVSGLVFTFPFVEIFKECGQSVIKRFLGDSEGFFVLIKNNQKFLQATAFVIYHFSVFVINTVPCSHAGEATLKKSRHKFERGFPQIFRL